MPTYNVEQQKFCMGFTAQSLVLSQFGSQKRLQNLATQKLQALLSNGNIKGLIGEWEVVWGPVVYQHDPSDSKGIYILPRSSGADNCMYMVKCNNDNSDLYVIGIAGTNIGVGVSEFGGLVEDGWIYETRLWNQGKPWESNPQDQTSEGKRVSAGISKGLQILCEMQSNGKSLLEYLRELTSSTENLSITVSGHGLGGTLSSTLALSLSDRRSDWDSEGKSDLSVFSIAGFSPGNGDFAEYYDGQLGDKTTRLWNRLDVVPRWFQADLLEELPNLYNPPIEPNFLINGFKNLFVKLSEGKNYQQICQNQEGVDSVYSPDALKTLLETSIKSFTDTLSKLISKVLVSHHLLIEAPSQELFDEVLDKVAVIKTPLIEAVIEEIRSEQETSKIDAGPFVEDIGNLLKDTLDLELDIANQLPQGSLVGELKDFIFYFGQMIFQHMLTYPTLMGVADFFLLLQTETSGGSKQEETLGGKKKKRKRKKQSAFLKPLRIKTFKVAKRSNDASKTYMKLHVKSNRKKKNGWLKDFPKNYIKSVSKLFKF